MKDRMIRAIRSRSREEWRALAFDRWTLLRIWIQEHGEKAAIYALFGGIIFVLAFKAVVLIAILGLLAGYIIYFVALPESSAADAFSKAEEPANRPPEGP